MKKRKLAAYLTSLMIFLAGAGIFISAIWYIVNFPVPSPIMPLKHRIFVILHMEKARGLRDNSVELIINERTIVYESPDEKSREIVVVAPGSYRQIGVDNEWYKIKIDQETEGWVNKKFIKGR